MFNPTGNKYQLNNGYTDCACRDCFEIAIGKSGEALCHDCKDAGCEADNGECQADGAYGVTEEAVERRRSQSPEIHLARLQTENGRLEELVIRHRHALTEILNGIGSNDDAEEMRDIARQALTEPEKGMT